MKKMMSAALAAAVAASLAGCTFATPATVGSIGDVEIPAGVYLMNQLNAYTSASSQVSDATSAKMVLAAQVTPENAENGETVTGQAYVEQETLKNIKEYAAIEAMFNEQEMTLDESVVTNVDATIEAYWVYNETVLTENGISKDSWRTTMLNSYKGDALFNAMYGATGEQAVSDAEYESYLAENAVSGFVLTIPTSNSQDTTVTVTDEQLAQLKELAQSTANAVNASTAETATGETALSQMAEVTINEAYGILGMEYSAGNGMSAYSTRVVLPETLSSYDQEDGTNPYDDAKNAAMGQAVVVDTGSTLLVFLRANATDLDTIENLKTNYNLLSVMKGDEFIASLQTRADEMGVNLDAGAMKTYAASKIKM